MKLILTHDVAGLGQAGEVVEVKDGYGRNYLIPRGYATAWTKGGQKQVDQIAEARRKRAIASLDEAHALRDSLQADTLQIAKSAGENGRLFGAVTTGEIADAIKEAGAGSVDKRKIEITTPMRSLGEYSVLVRLHPEVQATVDVKVARA